MTRSLRTAFRHISRSPFQAIAAWAVLTVTFFLAAIFSLTVTGSEMVIRYFETRPQVIAFFKDSAGASQMLDLKNGIEAIAGVTETNYITKKEALEIYREQNKNDPLLLEMVTADILPASLEVRAGSPEILPRIADLLSDQEIVEEVVFQKDIVDNLNRWTKALRWGGLGLVVFLMVSSVFMVIIIIGMKISNHRAEIEISRLLGATRWQVISPFVYEGMVYGVIGATLGWILAWLTLLYSTPLILSFFGSIPILPAPAWFLLSLLAGQIIAGVVIGFSASLAAARRFL